MRLGWNMLMAATWSGPSVVVTYATPPCTVCKHVLTTSRRSARAPRSRIRSGVPVESFALALSFSARLSSPTAGPGEINPRSVEVGIRRRPTACERCNSPIRLL